MDSFMLQGTSGLAELVPPPRNWGVFLLDELEIHFKISK
jgi:hypothetical protein